MIFNGQWRWPTARSVCHKDLVSFLPSVIPTGGLDTVLWMASASKCFHASSTWKWIRPKGSKVPWCHFVWFKESIPKHSFHTWLVVLNKLSTRDRQLKHNSLSDGRCVFCGGMESRDHLFFQFPYTIEVLASVITKVGKTCPSILSQLLQWGFILLEEKLHAFWLQSWAFNLVYIAYGGKEIREFILAKPRPLHQ